jgi:hypothetical protein
VREVAVSSRARVAGDVVRFFAVLSLVGAATTGKGVAAALFALVLLGLTLLRLLVSPRLDLATGLLLVAGAWASLLDLYLRFPGLDVPVHVLATGLGAAALHEALVRVGVLPGPDAPYPRRAALGAAVVVVALGLALGVIWELGEWYGHTHVDDRIQVGYDDTLGDLMAGGLGALAVAVFRPVFAARSRRSRRRTPSRSAEPRVAAR